MKKYVKIKSSSKQTKTCLNSTNGLQVLYYDKVSQFSINFLYLAWSLVKVAEERSTLRLYSPCVNKSFFFFLGSGLFDGYIRGTNIYDV